VSVKVSNAGRIPINRQSSFAQGILTFGFVSFDLPSTLRPRIFTAVIGATRFQLRH